MNRSDLPSWKRCQKAGKKARRQRKQQAAAEAAQFGPVPKPTHSQSYREQLHYPTSFSTKDLPASYGPWTGVRAKKHQLGKQRARWWFWHLEALLADGCEDPKLIVDAEGRIIAVLLGRPEGEDWNDVITEMERVMEGMRRRGRKRGILKSKDRSHRSGVYDIMSEAISMGSGQQQPGNFAHTTEYRRLLRHFLENWVIQHIAGFQSSGVARYFPKLWKYIKDTMQGIQEHQPGLCRPFKKSVYPAATFNMGPDTVTAEHCDVHNLPHSVCPVTSGGNTTTRKAATSICAS
ncbi:hypothetical protein B0H13DRAFT_2375336 [Mycena leptocephala]|nr:hypothetical protein B0H13DRAFT_2375336 [Mycena leptocephala]